MLDILHEIKIVLREQQDAMSHYKVEPTFKFMQEGFISRLNRYVDTMEKITEKTIEREYLPFYEFHLKSRKNKLRL